MIFLFILNSQFDFNDNFIQLFFERFANFWSVHSDEYFSIKFENFWMFLFDELWIVMSLERTTFVFLIVDKKASDFLCIDLSMRIARSEDFDSTWSTLKCSISTSLLNRKFLNILIDSTLLFRTKTTLIAVSTTWEYIEKLISTNSKK